MVKYVATSRSEEEKQYLTEGLKLKQNKKVLEGLREHRVMVQVSVLLGLQDCRQCIVASMWGGVVEWTLQPLLQKVTIRRGSPIPLCTGNASLMLSLLPTGQALFYPWRFIKY